MFDFNYQVAGARRRAHKVKGDVCSIGSARNNDLVVASRAIGKRHAELRLRTDGVYIRDLGSLSGCWVNSERVQEYGPLSTLDQISIADIDIILKPLSEDHNLGKDKQQVTDEFDNNKDTAENDAAIADSSSQKRSLFGKFSFRTNKSHVAEPTIDDSEEQPVDQSVLDIVNGSHSVNAATSGHGINTPDEPHKSKTARSQTQADGQSAAVIAVESDSSTIETPMSRHDVAEHVDKHDAVQEQHDELMSYWASIVHEQLLYQMDLRRKDVNRMSDDELRTEGSALITSIVDSLAEQLPPEIERDLLEQDVLNEAVGLGPLQQFLDDEEVTEIMVNNYQEIFLERAGRLERSRYRFSSDRTVFSVIERIITPLGRRIDESSPIVDARLKDGSRVNAVIPPLALKGPSMTIRKFPKHRLQFSDLIKYNSTSESMVDFLKVCVDMRKNIIVAGGTGSGKTTLLNVLSNFIPPSDRVVTIEDAAELKLVQPNLVSLEARPPNLEGKGAVPIRDLVKNSLRMRPDRIVVGECRGGEALDMLQAMNTGHDGSLTTIHANSPRDVISRLEVLVLMAGMELPVSAIREQVASAVDIIIQQTRFYCGSRKISKITEVVGVESGTVQLQDIFIFDQSGVDEDGRVKGEFRATGAIPTFYEELRSIGIDVNLDAFVEGARV